MLDEIALKYNVEVKEVEEEIEKAVDEMMNSKNLKSQLLRRKIFGGQRPSAEEFILKMANFINNE